MVKSLVAVMLLGSVSLADAEDELSPPGMTPPRAPATPVAYALDDETPPISGTRLAGEALLGGLFAVGGGIGGAYMGFAIETAGDCNGEFCGLGGIILGGAIGLTFATPVGVYLAGSHSGETGSLGATIGGSVLGSLVGIGAAAAAESEASVVLLVAGPVVGSMIGFNATRRYDRPRPRQPRWVPVASATHERATFGLAGSF